jgi:cyclophilin family peptidyl-prolyl cis-trans isomerase
MNQQLPQNRRVRRQQPTGRQRFDTRHQTLPGPLAIMTNRKVFIVVGVLFAAVIVLSLMPGVITGGTGDTGPVRQANELEDAPHEAAPDGTVTPGSSATPVAPQTKRYTAAPPMTIDLTKTYLATLKTAKGEVQIELYPSVAPEAVNAFVFLANDGYYNGTPFMELARNSDGSKFYAQAGDPTATGLGTPGFSIKKEQTSRPFSRGAVGMGGSAENSNGGQFFISFGDYAALNGKYTIFGQVVAGMDVVERLSLLEVSGGRGSGASDKIESITVEPR